MDGLTACLIDISVDRRRDGLLMQVKTTHVITDRLILLPDSVNQLGRQIVGRLVVRKDVRAKTVSNMDGTSAILGIDFYSLTNGWETL